MARRSKGGESKQGLVVALVFFVILALGLGGAAYMGFADAQEQKDKLKEAVNDKKSMEQLRNWNQFQNLHYRAYIGIPLSKDEEGALALRRKEWQDGKFLKDLKEKDEVEKVGKIIADEENENKCGWDKDKKKPLMSYHVKVDKTTKELEVERKKYGDLARSNEELMKKKDAEKEALAKQIKEREDVIAKLNTQINDTKKAQSQEYLKALENADARLKELKENEEKFTKEKLELGDKNAKLEKIIKDMENRYQKTLIKMAPVDLLAHLMPQGKVLDKDPGELVFINLGSADFVREQLTFSIFSPNRSEMAPPADLSMAQAAQLVDRVRSIPIEKQKEFLASQPADYRAYLQSKLGGAGAAANERKAAIEVVKVVDAHVSQARITEIRDANRDPILKGDLLFNPAWSPTLKEHVVIAGPIVLTEDGREEGTIEFKNNMEKQNIIVDGYLDMKDPSMPFKGAITHNTSYLVLGKIPEPDAERLLNKDDPQVKRLGEINTKHFELMDRASRLGVKVVDARRFMHLIGYKLPRNPRPPDYLLRAGTTSVSGESKKEGDKKEEMKKEEPKEK